MPWWRRFMSSWFSKHAPPASEPYAAVSATPMSHGESALRQEAEERRAAIQHTLREYDVRIGLTLGRRVDHG